MKRSSQLALMAISLATFGIALLYQSFCKQLEEALKWDIGPNGQVHKL